MAVNVALPKVDTAFFIRGHMSQQPLACSRFQHHYSIKFQIMPRKCIGPLCRYLGVQSDRYSMNGWVKHSTPSLELTWLQKRNSVLSAGLTTGVDLYKRTSPLQWALSFPVTRSNPADPNPIRRAGMAVSWFREDHHWLTQVERLAAVGCCWLLLAAAHVDEGACLLKCWMWRECDLQLILHAPLLQNLTLPVVSKGMEYLLTGVFFLHHVMYLHAPS